MWKYLLGIPRDRRWLGFLTAVNLGGFVYGLHWYEEQLATLPWYAWPVTADCPVSALLFGLLTASLLWGSSPPWLQGLAGMAALKYGIWTVLVIGQSWLAGAPVDVGSINLFWTHLGLTVEAVLFALVYRPPALWVIPGVVWVILNTLLDYGVGLHPTLPGQTPLALAAGAAGVLDVAVLAFFWRVGSKRWTDADCWG
ncbi:MAG TPA: DUF1405 domain-containing protein [Firmicutes bacterium]|nr:DUF1405 domain-containing protein [Bacillota bacterium]